MKSKAMKLKSRHGKCCYISQLLCSNSKMPTFKKHCPYQIAQQYLPPIFSAISITSSCHLQSAAQTLNNLRLHTLFFAFILTSCQSRQFISPSVLFCLALCGFCTKFEWKMKGTTQCIFITKAKNNFLSKITFKLLVVLQLILRMYCNHLQS